MRKSRGRHLCDTLKQVRQQIADAGGIEYTPRRCDHKGECRGTCPGCEAETRWLEDRLISKFGRDYATKVAGVAMAVSLVTMSGCSSTKNRGVEEVVGIMVNPNPPVVDSTEVKEKENEKEVIHVTGIMEKPSDRERDSLGNVILKDDKLGIPPKL